ncbi:hypothetical protein TWF102_007321 [Orbilia oligospora]|uniref:Uncharacterized protein n=1 Tax=Orbilia oligospora TaxID=2813651 RepID=A0A7C8NBI3_ORBOL|nr:hypothetical protein TWF102_007321 [Orbilia oligospora]
MQGGFSLHKQMIREEPTRKPDPSSQTILLLLEIQVRFCQKISRNCENTFVAQPQLVFIKSIKSNPKPPAPFPVAADLFAASCASILDKVFFRDFARFLAAAFVDADNDVVGIGVIIDRFKSPAATGMDLSSEPARGFGSMLVCRLCENRFCRNKPSEALYSQEMRSWVSCVI